MIWNIINLGQTQSEINNYSRGKLIIVKMTFQLRTEKNHGNENLEKNMYNEI